MLVGLLTARMDVILINQILRISLFNPSHKASGEEPRRYGHHDRIRKYSEHMDPEKLLNSELETRRGRMIVMGRFPGSISPLITN